MISILQVNSTNVRENLISFLSHSQIPKKSKGHSILDSAIRLTYAMSISCIWMHSFVVSPCYLFVIERKEIQPSQSADCNTLFPTSSATAYVNALTVAIFDSSYIEHPIYYQDHSLELCITKKCRGMFQTVEPKTRKKV